MARKFSIEELKLANDCCFPADFERLLRKHLAPDLHDLIFIWVGDYKNKYGSDLLFYISKGFNRADSDWIEVMEKVVGDLLY